MVALAIAGHPRWRASDLELQAAASPSFTSATLDRLRASGYAAGELFFIAGADAFADIETWKDYPAIFDRAHFAVVSRPGTAASSLRERLPAAAARMLSVSHLSVPPATTSIFLIDSPTADVSSTAIRARRASGLSIAGLVPTTVQQHIEQHGLYTNMPPDVGVDEASVDQAAGRLHGQN